MKIKHPFYKIEIDTSSKKYKKTKESLKNLYSKLPSTKCLFCPGKCGVEADCCKTFSPPMLLVEFVSILEEIDKWESEKQRKLLFDCLDSFINIEISKPCVLLNKTLCSIYEARPLGCRLFALYPEDEWDRKLNNISKELNMEKENVPFYKQCKNIEIEGNEKIVSTKVSDKIFKEIHELDIDFFEDKTRGREVVIEDSATYMPFETHYLCYKLGDKVIQTLTEMKLALKDLKKRKNGDALQYILMKKNLKEFIETLKNIIVTNKLCS